ncbi:hypothetical protein LshimejAT787_0901650 [Lyophyllum shimeji]|uniref:F-box domain-containing protein n=1 Tax=Lyophyllum shimeji TaxID=47721 RepID=A0A9P3PQR1_LYOSH|nr:hypothetical protein LshimejAT787_0901650 [Lyophyllum shimeji]
MTLRTFSMTGVQVDLSSHFTDPDGIEASALSKAAVREAARAYILDEIASSEAVTRLWKRRLNALTVVARLPPELLGTIFKYVAGTETPEYATVRWIAVSHVCWHWRRVALDCPDLWSNIRFGHPSLAAEMVQRSRMAPLTVFATLGDGYGKRVARQSEGLAVQAVLRQILSQMSRVKELSLKTSASWASDMLTELIALMDGPAPLLENLSISCLGRDDANRLSDSLVAGLPRLVHLDLSGCGMTWHGVVLRNLTSLKISNIPRTMYPSVHQLLTALSQMPSLEVLQFHSDFSPADAAHIPRETAVHLPCLHSFDIQCELSDCAALLDHVTYSKKARVLINCQNTHPNPANDVLLIHNLAEKLARGMEGQIKLLRLASRSVKCWRSIRTSTANRRAIPPTLSVSFSLELVGEFVKSLPLDDLVSLMVVGDQLDSAMWTKLGNINRLTRLEIGWGENDVAVLNTLSHGIPRGGEESTTSGQPGPTPTPQLKALRSLMITGWMFDADFEDSSMTVAEKLSDCLEARSEAGLKLRFLEIKGCRHVTDEDIECLEASVERLSWDGERNFTDEETDAYSVTYSDVEVL